ncbi:MAG: HAD-IA family hydrolase [Muribaculaceae bacterium]|nr:HAD-IA family hydrolase [Muribaculaceae bacterium]
MNVDIHYHDTVVVFDLDDTLIRERDFCRTGFKVVEDYLTERYDNGRFKGLCARMIAALEARLPYLPVLEDALAPDLRDIKEDVLDIYGAHVEPAISPSENVVSTLELLKSRGIRMGLITDGRSRTQRAKLQSANLLKYFSPDMIYISEERGADKSRPDSFTDIVRKFPEAKRFIYVGDNPEKDIFIPTLLGWETAILTYNQDNAHFQSNNADIIDTATYKDIAFEQLLQIIS